MLFYLVSVSFGSAVVLSGLWVSQFMSGQDSVFVLPVTLMPGKQQDLVLPPNWQCPTASCLPVLGCFLLSFLKRGLHTVPQCLPSSACVFLLPCLLPVYTKVKSWASGGSKKRATCGCEAAVFTPCAVDP